MSEPVGAILVAAGASRRMGFDKLWARLDGRPLVSFSLETLVACSTIDQVALVVAEHRLAEARALAREQGARLRVCPGGEERRDSVAAGLAALDEPAWVVVHDAARPFVERALIARGLQAARPTGAAIAALPARDTVKRVACRRVVETLRRAELWQVQTPQVFRTELLKAALAVPDRDVTDEATLVERLGGEVRVFEGAEANWKITTPADLELAEAWLLAQRARERGRERAGDGTVAVGRRGVRG